MMEDKYHYPQEVPGYPLAPATVVPRSDEVSAPPIYQMHQQPEPTLHSKKRKRMQCLAIIIAFVVIQVIIVLLLLFITRVTTPAVDLGDVLVTRGEASDSLRLTGRVRVKNANFGRFKFDGTTVTVRSSGNDDVSQFVIPGSRVGARSSKKISVVVDLGGFSGLEDSDQESGPGSGSATVNVKVEGKLKGNVEVWNMIKKKRTAELDCKIRVQLVTYEIRDLRCK